MVDRGLQCVIGSFLKAAGRPPYPDEQANSAERTADAKRTGTTAGT
jgi:hypothetical protein